MGIISTIAGAIGGKVVDCFTGNIGNKVIDTVNDFLGDGDKLSKDATSDQLMEAYYNKLTPEERQQAAERFIELENEAERINVELQKAMGESDKNSGGYRKWVSIIMALTIAGTSGVYTYLIYNYIITTNEWPSMEILFGTYAIPGIVLLLSCGLSGRNLKELIVLIRPKEKSGVESTVDKVLDSIKKKK